MRDSPYNRRITATTPMEVTGPAAGHDLAEDQRRPDRPDRHRHAEQLRRRHHPLGHGRLRRGELPAVLRQPRAAGRRRSGLRQPRALRHHRRGSSERHWEKFYDRFDLTKEPNEPFRFGWGVEFDPYDPTSTPKKRTALGRNKHEGHTSVVAPSGQVVIYSGDDERFEYAYKFVTAGTYNPDDRAANLDLLDEGTLYVAKFNDDGTGEWLPLVYGEGR